MQLDIVADGLGFPEGPIAMADGSVIVVEIKRQTLTRCWDGRTEIIARLGGGPNGAAIGPDGAVYVCNNGGAAWIERSGITIPAGIAPDYSGGRIERVDLRTGRVDRLYDRAGEHPLRAPNDLVFDRAGGMWFTDFGHDLPRQRDKSGIYHAAADGSRITEVTFGSLGYNGIGLSPDERTLYAAETLTGRLIAFDVTGPGEIARKRGRFPGRVVATMKGDPLEYFDSLAVTAAGNVCVATLIAPGITTIAPDGTHEKLETPDIFTTNLCFGGKDMRDVWITLSGGGTLARARWHEPGLRLAFNA
ncbi:MAG TPA: SMP-30/gluconolactonase/LRE family protein [Kofleriaceae bacterium]|nr:SMP-30/gluconolactonase/LRE family protein [Kofleriaceae bacterium]